MDRLLSRQRLDQIERDQRLDQRSYGDKITQMQQQLNQRPSSPADEIQNHYLLYRLQQDFNQLQLEHRQGYLRRQQEIERLERLQEQRRLGKDPQFEWLRREHRQDHARQRNSLDQLEGEIERLQRQPAR